MNCTCGQGSAGNSCANCSPQSPAEYSRTLAAKLVPCVDEIRGLYACFGARPYELWQVWTRWDSGTRGVGVEEVLRERPLTPTPLVVVDGLDETSSPIGALEDGVLRVSQVSPRYTEDDLRGCDNGSDPNISFYYEVRALVGANATRRRFLLEGAPGLDALKFEWVFRLRRAFDDRTRAGFPMG